MEGKKNENMIFLFNPRSGREQIRSQLMGILDYFCSQGYFPSVYVTQNSQDAERIAREYGSSAASVFYAAAGRHFKQCGIGPHGAGKTAGAGLSSLRLHQRLCPEPGDPRRSQRGRGGCPDGRERDRWMWAGSARTGILYTLRPLGPLPRFLIKLPRIRKMSWATRLYPGVSEEPGLF